MFITIYKREGNMYYFDPTTKEVLKWHSLPYYFQTPFISLVPIEHDLVKKYIFRLSLRLFDYFTNVLGYYYSPVLTILASEKAVLNLRALIKQDACHISELNSDYTPSIHSLITLFKELFPKEGPEEIDENRPECKIVRNILLKIVLFLPDMSKEQIDKFWEAIKGIHYSHLKSTLDCFFKSCDYYSARFKEASKKLIKDLKTEYNKSTSITAIYGTQSELESIENKIMENEVLAQMFKACSVKIIAEYILEHIKDIGIKKDPGSSKVMLSEVFHKYGCYVPASFFEYHKRHRSYTHVLKMLGVPSGIELSDYSCIFIYPLPIFEGKQVLDEDIEDYFKNYSENDENSYIQDLDTFKWYIFAAVFAHEHAHALLRHGIAHGLEDPPIIPEGFVKMDLPDFPTSKNEREEYLSSFEEENQDKLDNIRGKEKWIEEGLAHAIARHFCSGKWCAEREKNSVKTIHDWIPAVGDYLLLSPENTMLSDFITKHSQCSEDLDKWPYAGLSIIDYYLKLNPRSFLFKFQYAINKWKTDPSELISDLMDAKEKFEEEGHEINKYSFTF